jgi:hypothetical protein
LREGAGSIDNVVAKSVFLITTAAVNHKFNTGDNEYSEIEATPRARVRTFRREHSVGWTQISSGQQIISLDSWGRSHMVVRPTVIPFASPIVASAQVSTLEAALQSSSSETQALDHDRRRDIRA